MNEAPRNQSEPGSTTGTLLASERRARVTHTIRELVSERQQVLVYYWDLTELIESEDPPQAQLAEQLKQFCQMLVDYTALGHFEVYQRVVEGKERRGSVRQIADRNYATIVETTDALIDFNDKYDSNEAPENRRAFANDLGRVGKALSVRIDLEDQLLDALGNKSPQ